MNKYEIIPSVNYGAFTDFIYNKLKIVEETNLNLQYKSRDIVNEILDEAKGMCTIKDCIWEVLIKDIFNEYIKEFTELLNLKEDYYIIFTD
jgi:hypothetical protein